MPFAEYTKVPVQQTKAEIENYLKKRGATHYATMSEPGMSIIAFRLKDRNIRFNLPMPAGMKPQPERSRWRALMLVIKAKMESVDAGIETFEESFLAHVVMPGGRTVYEEIKSPIALGYQGGNVQLLPPPTKEGK